MLMCQKSNSYYILLFILYFFSSFTLNISEIGNLTLYTGPNRQKYLSYSHLPIKPHSDYYTLEDVNINGQALHGEHVNLLVAIKKVKLTSFI